MKTLNLFFSTFVLVLASSGCGSSTGPIDASADLSTAIDLFASSDQHQPQPFDMVAGDLSLEGDMAGAACNFTLANTAQVVTQTVVNQPMPSATMGGSITPGTYHLTASYVYAGGSTTALLLRVTQTITGNIVQQVESVNGSPDTSVARSFTTSGTTLDFSFLCATGSASLGFDATSTQYLTYNAAAKTVNTFTRQ